jgi:hypothetical protein
LAVVHGGRHCLWWYWMTGDQTWLRCEEFGWFFSSVHPSWWWCSQGNKVACLVLDLCCRDLKIATTTVTYLRFKKIKIATATVTYLSSGLATTVTHLIRFKKNQNCYRWINIDREKFVHQRRRNRNSFSWRHGLHEWHATIIHGRSINS